MGRRDGGTGLRRSEEAKLLGGRRGLGGEECSMPQGPELTRGSDQDDGRVQAVPHRHLRSVLPPSLPSLPAPGPRAPHRLMPNRHTQDIHRCARPQDDEPHHQPGPRRVDLGGRGEDVGEHWRRYVCALPPLPSPSARMHPADHAQRTRRNSRFSTESNTRRSRPTQRCAPAATAAQCPLLTRAQTKWM